MTAPNINAYLRANPRNCRYGAPMGRADQRAERSDWHFNLYCQRVTFTDGCYSADGTYWGSPANLWAAFSADFETLLFTRAASRAEAIAKFRDTYDGHGYLYFRRDEARHGLKIFGSTRNLAEPPAWAALAPRRTP